jgi:acetylornithine deacetylase/succinyl-diaminopimelate desuccinylase-like protein
LAFIKTTYPLAFSGLEVEAVAKYSVLLTWQSTNNDLRPVFMDLHYDMVPIELGTEGDWQQPPVDGVIVDGVIVDGVIVDNYPLFEDQLMAMVALAEKNLCHPNTYR